MSTEGTLTLEIDGRKVAARLGETVLEAARRDGIDVPTLCHDPRLAPAGNCRSCLVEIDGQRRLQPSCTWKAQEGQVVSTGSDRVKRHREVLFSMYLADHRAGGADDALAPKDELMEHVAAHGAPLELLQIESPRVGRDDPNPYIHFDPTLCILCARCTRYCDEVEGVSAITLAGRGAATTIATAGDISLMDSTCELCGGCIDTCPTGALREKKAMALALPLDRKVEKTRTTCNFCGVGCQLDLHVADGRVVKVTSPPPGETVNDGNLCVKGRFAYDFVHHEDRLTEPMVRDEDGQIHVVSWEVALARAAEGLLGVKERHGADGLGFISSSRCTGEENYLVQKISRAVMGTNNVHQCSAT